MAMTRRQFVARVARAGGYGAAFSTMCSLGLFAEPSGESPILELPPGSGKGVKVVILGSGIAGMVSAYEMNRAGYSCTVLEARSRPGGRNWTIRNGTQIVFTNGLSQTCSFQEEGSYFNAGPARLPSIHLTMLNYCRELGVPLEVEVNSSRSSLLQNDLAFGGKPVRQRQAVSDTRGHVSELLSKCIYQHALNQELTSDDEARMIEFLRQYGDLQSDGSYKGSERGGTIRAPGAGAEEEILNAPLSMHALLDGDFWLGMMFEEMLDMQATMFQPVGGMDRIAYAFANKLGSTIQYDSRVKEIRKTTNGVRIVHQKGPDGPLATVEADYCICALPLSILKDIPSDLSPATKLAVGKVTYDAAFKIAWESERFWETDYNIYGGISFLTKGPIGLVWYPSAKLFSHKGVLLSGYAVEAGSGLDKLGGLDAKLTASRLAVEKLHPGRSAKLANPVYVNWGEIPYNLGSWVSQGPDYVRLRKRSGEYYDGPYQQLMVADDRIYFAGDHCTHLIGWQEGAALSAHRAVAAVAARARNAPVASAG